MSLVPLYRYDEVVAHTQVDPADFDMVMAVGRWHRAMGYAARGKGYGIRLHRFLLGLEKGDGRQADHINRDRLDNRRCNLRIVSAAENAQNRTPYENKSSRYRGVTWDKRNKKWMVRVKVNGQFHYFGLWDDEDAAGRVAEVERRRLLPFSEG